MTLATAKVCVILWRGKAKTSRTSKMQCGEKNITTDHPALVPSCLHCCEEGAPLLAVSTLPQAFLCHSAVCVTVHHGSVFFLFLSHRVHLSGCTVSQRFPGVAVPPALLLHCVLLLQGLSMCCGLLQSSSTAALWALHGLHLLLEKHRKPLVINTCPSALPNLVIQIRLCS